MDLVAIGDIHGRDIWKKIVNKHPRARKVFIGDYFDSWDVNGRKQIDNFKEIVEYSEHDANTNLLFGNHEYHYISSDKYTGYNPVYAIEIKEVLTPLISKGQLKICCKHNDILFSHAGVTKTWYESHVKHAISVVDGINELLRYTPDSFQFYGRDPSGDNITQSPIWVRPKSLLLDKLDYTQVVGHTQLKKIVFVNNTIFIDTLQNNQYLLYSLSDRMNAMVFSVETI